MFHYLPGAALDSDPEEYARAESFWNELWAKLMDSEAVADGWQTPWLQTTFADGTPIRDGNPIFSAYSPTLRRAVRVIQYEPTSEELEFEHWVDTVGEETEGVPIRELVIACALSEQAAMIAQRLIRDWARCGQLIDIESILTQLPAERAHP